jgi:hypothetical protein
MALDQAKLGTTILLEAGATYTPPSDIGFILRNKTSGSGWIIIKTNTPLPAEGVRVTPSDATKMAKILRGTLYAISTEKGAHHYRLIGLEVLQPGNATNLGGLVVLEGGETTLAARNHHIVLDRMYLHGSSAPHAFPVRFGVVMNGQHQAVINSWIEDITYESDSQAIIGWGGAGPFKIVNNGLSAASENVMFGGAIPLVNGVVPSDIEVRNNYFFKPLKWRDDPNYTTAPYPIRVKNLFELKNAQRVLFDGNVLENSWPSAQGGIGFMMTPRGGNVCTPRLNCADPWTVVQDITITNNWFKNVNNLVGFSGQDNGATETQIGGRVLFKNNLATGLGSLPADGDRGAGRAIAFTVAYGIFNVTIDHNTIVAPAPMSVGYGRALQIFGDPTVKGSIRGFIFTNNLHLAGDSPLVFEYYKGNSLLDTLAWAMPGYVWSNNAMAGPWPTKSGFNQSMLPSQNFFPPTEAAIGYMDLAGGNYRLAPTSPYKNRATDGTDLGVDWNAFNAATACTMSGACGVSLVP